MAKIVRLLTLWIAFENAFHPRQQLLKPSDFFGNVKDGKEIE
jgi:hypothetical protein